jgi:hypothetical protein
MEFFTRHPRPHWPLVATSAALLAWGCGSTTKPTPSASAVTLDGAAAAPDAGSPAPDLSLGTPAGPPAMDKAAPTVTQTATFALG